ncbi:MAG: GyrI-like domain-containing protein [Chthonomonas sp.]|nr:GyrI-like domain-containing protein [Chthonomonas sp.]
MDVELVKMPPLRLFAIRHIGPYPQIGKAFTKLFQAVEGRNIKQGDVLGVYHDNPLEGDPAALRSDAALVLGDDVAMPQTNPNPLDGELHGYLIDEDLYARVLHVGSYEGLPQAWMNLGHWFATNNRTMSDTGACFERYLNDICETPEAELRTEIYISIVPE